MGLLAVDPHGVEIACHAADKMEPKARRPEGSQATSSALDRKTPICFPKIVDRLA